MSGSGGGPNAASAHQFVRAEMLPSGYLVRPCEGGGSIVHIVDHLDLEVWFPLCICILILRCTQSICCPFMIVSVFFFFQARSVPEVLRPLYESSRVVAQKMTTVVHACNYLFQCFQFKFVSFIICQ